MAELKLFAWQPQGHGEYSFFVLAETESEALEHVDRHIKDARMSGSTVEGWGTDYYELTVAARGEVLRNAND